MKTKLITFHTNYKCYANRIKYHKHTARHKHSYGSKFGKITEERRRTEGGGMTLDEISDMRYTQG
jgi:hypothetical protein